MRITLRLLLVASVAACTPMVPSTPPGPVTQTPAPQAEIPPAEPQTPPVTAPAAQTDLSNAYNAVSFDAWREDFLNRYGGERRWEYARELQNVTPNASVIRLDRNQPEFSRPAGTYIQNATAPARIAMARQRVNRVPASVTQRFGVPAEILMGIWAQESAFGAVQGDFDVIRSLATLAYDGRRRQWAEEQLKHALDIVVTGKRSREGLKGSWAGAMGQTQFMPDNYLRLGIDQNGDGVVDIWGSDADALASAANLLAQGGWKRGQGWAYEVTLPSGFDYTQAEGPKHNWAYWQSRGVRLTNGQQLNEAEMAEEATILLPQGARGPVFLALPNHYVIRRYNNSVSYALAIGLIADGVMGKPALTASWPNDGPLTREQRIGAQTALTKMGYDTQGVDGVIGANTRAALRRWQAANGRTADGYLTDTLAEELIRRAR
ncbi:lytic murein transglycosylase [uncultured Brevundimonas sp.]|uniref:lytic murein transglycosylase n=1 Tax=uncultured Brevundimonas sp. TaxID=213418 RepID=UPI00261B0835|nr:lytic murein transglycosylase [uncultured Brevundimonas sp.]